MKYIVVSNYCNCHPETCCCDDLAIVDNKTGKTYITGNNCKSLQEICDLKNNGLTNAQPE